MYFTIRIQHKFCRIRQNNEGSINIYTWTNSWMVLNGYKLCSKING